jgi:hypothetical protein
VLGWQLGLARAIGAILFAIIAGLLMAYIFRKDDANRETGEIFLPEEEKSRPLWQNGLYMLAMVLILIFASFARPSESDSQTWQAIYSVKWYLTAALLIVLAVMLKVWFVKQELKDWVKSSWDFALQILPLLLAGVLIAGFLLGRPGHPALIPEQYIQALVGGNSFFANFFASIVGALMYFATLTEVPILQGLIGSGMGQGPALALLLAGPALSLPNMIAIASVMGIKKTAVYCIIVVILSTIAGMLYGLLVG